MAIGKQAGGPCERSTRYREFGAWKGRDVSAHQGDLAGCEAYT